MSEIVLIVAAAEKGVIGKDGTIPWRLPDDLRRFRALTLGHPVVMGRKTWDSLPKKPLPGRRNIVVTRRPGWKEEGAVAAASLEEALALAEAENAAIFVIGGAEMYRAAMPRAHRIELTEIHRAFAGDAYFPAFDKTQWRETAREDRSSEDGLGYSFVTLQKAQRDRTRW